MSSLARLAGHAARWIFGGFYTATGVWIVVATATGSSAPEQPTAAAAAFTKALTASGFVDSLLAATYIAGGLALLRVRTAPLGIVLLAPAVAVIFFFHLVLSGQWVWGSLNLVWLAALAWAYRAAFVPLWRHAGEGRSPGGGA